MPKDRRRPRSLTSGGGISMDRPSEEPVEFLSAGYRLRGVVHKPMREPAEAGILFIHPFAEEKKCSHRVFVEMARAAAEIGCAALRFDLRGCGDSEGDFEAADVDAWRGDVREALSFARSELPTKRLGVLGLRLGATLAAELAEAEPGLAFLILWEPVTEGDKYLALTMRRSMMRKKLTVHEGGGPIADQQDYGQGAEIDFDGYLVAPIMQTQIAQINLLDQPKHYPGPTLVLNLSGRDKIAPPMEKLASLYTFAQAKTVRQEPIWSTVGLINPTPTIHATISWLRGVLGCNHRAD